VVVLKRQPESIPLEPDAGNSAVGKRA